MVAIVTGAGGFLGSKLVMKLLEAGHEVRGIDRQGPPLLLVEHPRLRWFVCDLGADAPPDEAVSGGSLLFHLAGATLGARLDEAGFLAANEATTINVLKACAGRIGKVVHASSQVVYGDPNSCSVSEEAPLNGFDTPYACSKLNSETWLRWFQQQRGGEFVALRLSGFVEGGGAIGYMADQALHGENIELFGQGRICRDYLAVNDGIVALKLAAERSLGEGWHPVNIGSGEVHSGIDLARMICREIDSPSAIVPVDKPAPRGDFVFNIEKARRVLGFQPLPLVEAVRGYLKARKESQ